MKLTKAQVEILAGMERWAHPVTGSRLSRILDKQFSDWAGPKLAALLGKELVEVFEVRSGQKFYVLTPAGLAALAEHRT